MVKPRSLKYIFYRNLGPALAVPLLLMSLFTIFTAYQNARTQMVANSKRVSTLLSNTIKTSLQDSENRITALAKLLDDGKINSTNLPFVLGQILKSHGSFLDIRVLNDNGIVWAMSPHDEDAIGLDMSRTPQFFDAKKHGVAMWSKAYISAYMNQPTASISVPFSGGVIVANYDFVKLRISVGALAPEKGLTVAILDGAGTILANSDSGKALRRERDSNADEYLALSKKSERLAMFVIDGHEELITVTPISVTGWTLVVAQDMQLVMDPVYRLAYTYSGFAIVFMLLGIALAYHFLSRVFSYFQKLIVNIRRVSDGSYQLDLPHEGIREMEEVEENFYRMSQHIRTREVHIVELNEELQFRLGEAETASRAKSEFLANMSHELRTPLNGALGMLQLLQMCDLNSEQKDYAEIAIRSCKNLTDLLNDILDLSRIEANRMPIILERFHLSDIYTSLEEIFGLAAREKGVDLILEVSPEIPDAQLGDPVRIKQILFNLVGNAVKFTSEGSIVVEAYPLPSKDLDSYRVLFSVSDTGLGIEDSQLENIFEPFTQTEASFTRRFGGAGLGLSIVKRLVELMGGKISIASSLGGGTVVYFCLTFGPVPGQDEKASVLAEVDIEGDLSAVRVLVAEDEQINQMLIEGLLIKQGIHPVCVKDGQEAIAMLESNSFDMVLMDVQMPVMDGMSAIKLIRASGKPYANLPVIALTAYAMGGDKEKFLEAGFSGYISKPLEFEDLLRVLLQHRSQ
ncbi:hybrid sensor histidine kinase/response regulator [Maridesulfovibrio frigidus]|uniref:hybrid sensor histidine kinase/response regulator n=1 Tax=Maridesulfovibrio frigidus TaxID=340956 RepID=UPI0006894DA8|nr:hybrid sensor histidine kinase/response regulator [Maridesulfovibrio frigidus]